MPDYTPLQLFAAERFGLEQHTATGRYCLSIAVCTRWVEYLEHYELTAEEFEQLSTDLTVRLEWVEKCRARQNDSRLMEPPPAERGTPCTGERGAVLLRTHPKTEFRILQHFREEWFTLAQQIQTGKYCLQIPVILNPHLDGDENYELTHEEYNHLSNDKNALLALVEKCRSQKNDARFMGAIPTKRGTPC